MATESVCVDARNRLWAVKLFPKSRHPPQSEPSSYYFRRSDIIEVLKKVGIQEIYHCKCTNCGRLARANSGYVGWPMNIGELLGEYATLYGLLIFINRPWLISFFQKKGLSLHKHYLNKQHLDFLEEYSLFDSGGLQNCREEILLNQYRFQVRQFSARNFVSEIDKNEILPITENEKPLGRGDFGEVYDLEIDKEYLDESLRLNEHAGKFARKIFTQHDPKRGFKVFVQEWLNQYHVNKDPHPNLMSALAAYEHGEFFSILYEFAESTLFRLLVGVNTINFDSHELWTQVEGLSRGLASLHGFLPNGSKSTRRAIFHLDLKPANILIVRSANGPVMKITDFGISRWEDRPDPTFPESSSSGSNQWLATGSYFPPPGGLVVVDDAKFDLYSLGCIMSEIACFGVGTHSGVDRYRKQRVKDNPDEQSANQNFCYFSDRVIKESVVGEHSSIIENAKEHIVSSNTGYPDFWKPSFYQREIFNLIEELLNLSIQGITAYDVAEEIKTLSKRAFDASEARRQSSSCATQLSREEIREQQIINNFAKSPTIPECEFRGASYEGVSCDFQLYPEVDKYTIRMRSFIGDQDTPYKEEKINRKESDPYCTIKPDYLRARSFSASLVRSKDQDHESAHYKFENVSDVLRFQGFFTGKHVFKGVNFTLTEFALVTKNFYGKFSKEVISTHAHLQMWTNTVIREGQDPPRGQFLAKIAVITEEKLHLIRVKNEFSLSSAQGKPLNPNFTEISNAQIHVVDIKNGIPLIVKEPANWQKYPKTQVWFMFEDSHDVKTFWNHLEELQSLWETANS